MHHLSAQGTLAPGAHDAMSPFVPKVQPSGKALWVPADLRQKALKPHGFPTLLSWMP